MFVKYYFVHYLLLTPQAAIGMIYSDVGENNLKFQCCNHWLTTKVLIIQHIKLGLMKQFISTLKYKECPLF